MKKLLLLMMISVFIDCNGQSEHKIDDSFKFLTVKELESKSQLDLFLIRNEVFARKGYVFKSKDLNDYFNDKSWYEPNNSVRIKLSDEEEQYISKIKEIENKFSQPENNNCLYSFGLKNLDFFPLTSDNLLNDDYKYSDSLDKIKVKDLNPIIEGNLCGGGSVWNIKCYENIKYQLLFYTCGSDNLYMSIAIIEGGKIDIKTLYGIYVHDFKNVDKYSFVLDHDNLEITKTNFTNTEDYKEKEVSKEVVKYKLSDTGLIKL